MLEHHARLFRTVGLLLLILLLLPSTQSLGNPSQTSGCPKYANWQFGETYFTQSGKGCVLISATQSLSLGEETRVKYLALRRFHLLHGMVIQTVWETQGLIKLDTQTSIKVMAGAKALAYVDADHYEVKAVKGRVFISRNGLSQQVKPGSVWTHLRVVPKAPPPPAMGCGCQTTSGDSLNQRWPGEPVLYMALLVVFFLISRRRIKIRNM